LFIVVEEILRSLYWFHPAVWWALSRIHLSREQVVDCEVLRVTGERQLTWNPCSASRRCGRGRQLFLLRCFCENITWSSV